MRDHRPVHRAWEVVEPIGKGRRVPVAERVKVRWIGAEEPVPPAASRGSAQFAHAVDSVEVD